MAYFLNFIKFNFSYKHIYLSKTELQSDKFFVQLI